MTTQPQVLLDRYQVGDLLSVDGLGRVHRGLDRVLGRDVAIKMLRTGDAAFRERLRRAAQNAARLNHPAIVAVYDFGETVSTRRGGEMLSFIVMEFINGRTLKEVLAAEERLPPRRALEIIADVCAALEFSHRRGIIHRDVKPGNVMITRHGQVKVMDFGITWWDPAGVIDEAQASAVIGTAQYLSPEQARGAPVDARSDVYAAGCVLFEMLAGSPPFAGDSPVVVAYQHVREDPRAPSELDPRIPPDVDAVVLKALAKDPQDRYQSAQEMRADALRAATGRPVMAAPARRPDDTWETPAPGVRRPERRTAGWWRRKAPARDRAPDDDATPPMPIITYGSQAPGVEFAGSTIQQLEEQAAYLKVQVDNALRRQDWAGAASLRDAESAVYTELLRRTRAAPEQDPGGQQAARKATPGRIFLCYRREDLSHLAGRVADRLIDRFGDSRVFIDVDSVEPGVDFVEEVRRVVGSCEVLLALIGPHWIDAELHGRRRLDDPEDVVALELREALRGGVRVIPVLVDGAPMPRREQLPAGLEQLTRRNAMKLGHETFRSDFDRLMADLAKMLSAAPEG